MKTFPQESNRPVLLFQSAVVDIQFYETKFHLEWSVIRLKALQMASKFYPTIEKASKEEKSM